MSLTPTGETELAQDPYETSPDPDAAPVCMAPESRGKKVRVYTNNDIPQAETTSPVTESFEDEDDDEQQ